MPPPVEALTATAFGALLGAVIGGLLVTGLIGHLHPQPSSTTGVQDDLGRILAVFVAVVNTALLLTIFTRGKGVSSVVTSLPYILVGDVSVALMLWRASTSISRAMIRGTPKSEHVPANASPWPRAW